MQGQATTDPKEIWMMLDDLSAKDPQKYKEYIEKIKKDALNATRRIQPGYYVSAIAKDGSKHYLNVCHCKAVAKCTDGHNVPTLLSNARKWAFDGDEVTVYDAVFHSSILEREDAKSGILELAHGCVEEIFKVGLIASSKISTNFSLQIRRGCILWSL